MADLTERFGTMVFSEDVMKKWLPKDVYKKLAATTSAVSGWRRLPSFMVRSTAA